MMADYKYYGGITRQELKSLRTDLAKEGVSVPEGDDVMVEGPHGIQLQASYDESKQTLKINITKKPFFIPDSMIWNIVDSGVEPYEGE
jgi:hypothetical protein